MKIYFAKSKLPNGKQPTVKEHTDLVADYAERFGEPLGIATEARLVGQFHDFGKYGDDFQDMLNGANENVDHAVCGAAYINYVVDRKLRTSYPKPLLYCSLIEAINGHHDGLRHLDREMTLALEKNMTSESISLNAGKHSALSGQEQYAEALKAFRRDHPNKNYKLPSFKSGNTESRNALQYMLFTRMLFSCLVDADHSVSAYERDEEYFRKTDGAAFDAMEYTKRLYSYRAETFKASNSDEELNNIRNDIFEICGRCGAERAEGLFTLTAPTGTGKTLALLHFALKHCMATGKKRIVIVLPFLTLAEQNTAIYEKIIPDVLVDHSLRDMDDEEKELAARWSSPFIITTSVRFFEALFAHRPSDCRKLHNIANSVVIFDEAQSLPNEITRTTLQAVNELCATSLWHIARAV